jgi:hypothetical protein
VGIGTASPANKLDVVGIITASGSPSNPTGTTVSFYNGSGVGSTISGYQFAVRTGGTPAEAMRIDPCGNVGIGTASPSGKLNVSDATSSQININSSANGATRQVLFSTSSNTQEAQISANNNTGELKFESGRSGTSAYFQTFYTNNSERMRIDSSGNLLVGGTTAIGKTSIYWDSSAQQGITTRTSSTTFNGSPIQFLNSSGVQSGAITQSASAVSYTTGSDYRLKENIVPMTGALAKVQVLKPVTYDWKVGGSSQGFIAHELAEVCPDAVSGEKDAVDADGKPKYQGVDTSFLVATLTAAIQELKAINDTQAETINALTARIVALESK